MTKLQIQQLAMTCCIWALVVSVESKSAIFAYLSQPNILAGLQFAAITVLGAILAALGFTLIGQMKADPRPSVRNSVWLVRIISCVFLLFPVFFFGSSVKLPRIQAEWEAYIQSPKAQNDRQLAAQITLSRSDRTAEGYEITEAADRLVRPTNANLTPMDGEFWFALVLLGLLNLAAERFRIPTPETDEERKARLIVGMTPEQVVAFNRSEGGKKGAATRRRNRQIAAAGAIPIRKGKRKS